MILGGSKSLKQKSGGRKRGTTTAQTWDSHMANITLTSIHALRSLLHTFDIVPIVAPNIEDVVPTSVYKCVLCVLSTSRTIFQQVHQVYQVQQVSNIVI